MRQVLSVPSQLGLLLKAARKDAGLSQGKLAERVGISQSRMSHMELNPGSVSLEQLLAIFAELGLEVVVASRPSVVDTTATQALEGIRASATARVGSTPGKAEW
jgi:HTH-type transcriptional regulator/antitoxin HipB